MPNGNVPTPPSPQNIANMVMQDVNTAMGLCMKPINDGMGWVNQAVGFVTAWPGRVISAVKPGGM